MNATINNSILSKTPAWASSLFTAIFSLFIPFIVAGIGFLYGNLLEFSELKLVELDAFVDLIGYLITGICVAIMCFLICKAHPKSLWYTPFICNGMTLLMGENYLTGNLELNQLLFTLGIGWILSIIGAIWGSTIGKRAITKDKIH